MNGLSRRHAFVSMFVGLLVALAGCSGSSDGTITDPSSGVSSGVWRVTVLPKVDTIFVRDTVIATDTVQLRAAVQGWSGAVLTGVGVRWSTADSAVTVDSTGVVRPRRLGTATVMGRSGGREDASTVVVARATTRLQILSPARTATGARLSTDSIFVGDSVGTTDSLRLSPVALNAAGDTLAGVRYTWASSDPAIATIDSLGTVRAAGPRGTVTITARGAALEATRPLTVLSSLRTVQLAAPSDTVYAYFPTRPTDGQQYTATVAYWPSAPVTRTVRLRWNVPQTNVATVDSTGRLTARSFGPATVTVAAGDTSASRPVTVTSVVRSVAVSVPADTVLVGDSVRATAVAVGPTGRPVTDAPIRWMTLNTPPAPIATIDSVSGVAHFTAPGLVQFVAMAAGTTGMATAETPILERRFLSVTAGWDHTCSTISLGRVYCWGLRAQGQLGASVRDSVCYDDSGTAAVDCSLVPKRADSTVARINSVTAGQYFTCSVAGTSRAYCWGALAGPQVGQLGNGRATGSLIPVLVTSVPSFTQVSAGGQHACGITRASTLFCWGSDIFGQLATRGTNTHSTTPVPVNEETLWAQVSAGSTHTCATTTDGRVYCWGDNSAGQVDSGIVGSRVDTATPVTLPGVRTATFVSASLGQHSCALAAPSGAAFCWGSNVHGELGSGAVGGTRRLPVAVAGGLTFSRLATGDGFTCGLSRGSVYCWGRDDLGQLGVRSADRGSPASVDRPVSIDARTGTPTADAGVVFTDVSAGRRHACAITSDGRVYCWGSDILGALGTQLQAAIQYRPVQVAPPL